MISTLASALSDPIFCVKVALSSFLYCPFKQRALLDEHSSESVEYWLSKLGGAPVKCCIAVAANKSDIESKTVD